MCVCVFIPLQIYKYYSLFSSLPQIACLAFLSFQYPLFLFKGFKGAEKTNPTEVSFHQEAASILGLVQDGCSYSSFLQPKNRSIFVWNYSTKCTFTLNLCTWGGFMCCLLNKKLTALIQSRLTETIRRSQYASRIIILSRFDVIGLQYVLDQIMKRLQFFLSGRKHNAVFLLH